MRTGYALGAIFLILAAGRDSHAELELPDTETDVVRLEANLLHLDPDTELLRASGDVLLEVGELVINASSLELSIPARKALLGGPLTLLGEDFQVSSASLALELESRKMTLIDPELVVGNGAVKGRVSAAKATCLLGTCHLETAHGSACPHRPEGYRVRAERVTLHPSGDLDLARPVLEIDGRSVAAVPWLRLRPSHSPGFLPPRLGWDAEGGLIVGPAGRFPLGRSAFAEGHVAARTAQGLETRSRLVAPGLDVTLEHLLDMPNNHLRARGFGAVRFEGTSLALELDLTSGRSIIDDMATGPLDRALTHTASRGLVSTGVGELIVETQVEFIESFRKSGEIAGDVLGPRATLSAALPSTPLARYLWPSMAARMTRYGLASSDRSPTATRAQAPTHTQFDVAYGLEVPARLGPLSLSARGAARHQAWLYDRGSSLDDSTHLVAGDLAVGLPLARNYRTVRHHVEPYATYRITPWREGNTPEWVLTDADHQRVGQGAEVGARTDLTGRGSSSYLTVDVVERFDLPGFDLDPGPAYTAASVVIGPSWFSVLLDGSWDHEHAGPSTAGTSIRSQTNRDSFEVGTRWTGAGRGPHRDAPFGDATGPWFVTLWPRNAIDQLELMESVDISLTSRLDAFTGLRLGIWPSTVLHALWYGVRLRPSCGCITAALQASHRPETAVPDVMASLVMTGI